MSRLGSWFGRSDWIFDIRGPTCIEISNGNILAYQ